MAILGQAVFRGSLGLIRDVQWWKTLNVIEKNLTISGKCKQEHSSLFGKMVIQQHPSVAKGTLTKVVGLPSVNGLPAQGQRRSNLFL